ncbi:MAG: hypothetical protein QW166_03620 [Candidatus Bathyarchaeia archaeon]
MASQLLQHTLNLISQYDIPLTVRQVYYRLVAAGIIRNTRSNYNSLDRCLVNARLNGVIPFSKIEDRSRQVLAGDCEFYEPEDWMAWRIEALKESASEYELPYWHFQPQYVEVWLEKDALSALFKQVCDRLHVVLAPCRGYSSKSYLYEAAKRLNDIGKPITILFFSDLDPRGLDIQRDVEETLHNFGVDFNLERVALTRQHVEAYSLPHAPTKKTDTMARQWVETYGDNIWELDALDPNLLMQLVEQSILQHFNQSLFEKRNELQMQNRDKINEIVEKLFHENEEF